MRLVIIAVLATLPEIAHADMRIAIGNDVFTPPIDDNGFTNVEAAAGGSVERFDVGAHLELAVMRFHVVDERLALPGAYRPGWHGAWRAGVHYARGRVRVDYEYRANEDGSGEPFAVVAVTIKQAGGSF